MQRVSRRKAVVAIVLCAGQGTRMGAVINKVYLPILGKPLVVYALETLERVTEISEIVLVNVSGQNKPALNRWTIAPTSTVWASCCMNFARVICPLKRERSLSS